MAMYHFHITGPTPFIHDGTELPSDEVAWEEALSLVRDVESSMKPGDSWILDVMKEQRPLFRISVAAADFRRR
jgi:hypothetical protein